MAVSGWGRRQRLFESTIERMSLTVLFPYLMAHKEMFINWHHQISWRGGLVGFFFCYSECQGYFIDEYDLSESYSVTQRTNSYDKSQGLDLKPFLLPLESSVYGG